MDISIEIAIVKSFEELPIFKICEVSRKQTESSEGYDAQTNSAFKIV